MSHAHFHHSGSDDGQLSLLGLVEVESTTTSPATDAETSADGDTERAEKRYRRLLSRKERMGDLSGMAACYIRLGDVFLARGDSEQAGDMYRKSLKLARAASSAGQGLPPHDLL